VNQARLERFLARAAACLSHTRQFIIKSRLKKQSRPHGDVRRARLCFGGAPYAQVHYRHVHDDAGPQQSDDERRLRVVKIDTYRSATKGAPPLATSGLGD
jgi:hypothetical protein